MSKNSKDKRGRNKVVVNINEALDGYHQTQLEVERIIKQNDEDNKNFSEEYDIDDYDLEFNHEVLKMVKSLKSSHQRMRITNNSLGKSLQVITKHNETIAAAMNSLLAIVTTQADQIDDLRDEIHKLKNK